MASLSDILEDPNYVKANAATKKAIFDKYSATDTNYTEANAATQAAIRKKFGVEGLSESPSKEEVGLGEGLLRSTAAGAAFGFGEEAEALARSKMPEETRSYEEILDDLRSRQKQFSQQHPYLDIAGNIVGGVAAPLAIAAGISALPEAAALGGTVAAASRILPGAAKVAQLAAKYPTAALIARGAATGAGYGGVAGFGAGEGGFEERAKSAGEGALMGGAFGAAVPAVGKFLQFGAKGIRDIIRPFTEEGREKIAARVIQGLPDTVNIPVAATPDTVPGYKPTLAETTQSRELAEIQRSILGKDVADDLAARAKPAVEKYVATAQPGETAAPFAFKRQQYETAIEAAAKEKAATEAARSAAAERTISAAQQGLKKFTPEDKLISKISESAKSKVDDVLEKVREHESSLWAPFSNPEKPVPFTAMGAFKNAIQDYKTGLTASDKGIVPKEIWKQLSGLQSKTNFAEIQSIRSDLLGRARASTNYNDKRVLNELADVINDGVVAASSRGKGLPAEMLEQWNAARAATSNRAKVFGNPYVKGFFKEETKAAAPEAFLGRVLGGVEKKSKFEKLENMLDPFKDLDETVKATIPKELLDSIQANRLGLMQDVEQYLATDLGRKVGEKGIVSPNKLRSWKRDYEDLLKNRPDIGKKFESIADLQKAASEALDFASQKVEAKEIEKLGKFFDVDPYDTKAISNRIKSVFASSDKNAVRNLVKEVSSDQDALNGLKRGFLDTVLEAKDPYEVISGNKDKLYQIFKTPSEKKLLDSIEQTFQMSKSLGAGAPSENEAITKLLSERGFLPILLDKAGSRVATGAAMVGGGVLGMKFLAPLSAVMSASGAGAGAIGIPALSRIVLSNIYNAPRKKVVGVLKEAFLDPDKARALMQPIQQWTFERIPNFMTRGIGPASSYAAQKKAETQRKAVGGLASLKKRYG